MSMAHLVGDNDDGEDEGQEQQQQQQQQQQQEEEEKEQEESCWQTRSILQTDILLIAGERRRGNATPTVGCIPLTQTRQIVL